MNHKYKYKCDCGKVHPFTARAIAQMALGNEIIHTCKCGRRNILADGENLGQETDDGIR